ncbi:hypothetical protein HBH98_029380 [Parastagonospora nodorum]|nr:hypothetical protein HBI06_218960 [Parastagonospora nodorum]KAH4228771.1 hypothetical protein HBI05_201950 [Parastagonospora nodorum]KAH4309527.1 hypothetical protein HBI01_039370 [Parastagonospora nodorum]KAH4314494.1 hypothetical protein HBI02_059430 [Parastagonospora nodorum]KAH4335308.1 hypothetical protein HBI00_037530 [Parastagonospora nodorum]
MPNVGRPSKGCKHCRDRKVKCDQKRPSCSQCIRAGKVCFGYRDPLSMMFKNESDVVAKKAEKRYEVLAKQNAPPSSTKKEPLLPERTTSEAWESNFGWLHQNGSTHVVYTRYPTPESMIREIVPSIEDQALGFFIGNYVAQPTFVPRGQFEWVTELLAQPVTEDILRHSVNAATLAGFANATKSPSIMKQAQTAYVSALRLTNSALRFKESAVRDSTLISVIMLGMYENFMFQDRRSISAWAKHVDGASALLNLRGKEQFRGNLGRRLFHQFYGVIMLVALETGRPVHQGIHDLYQIMTPTSDYSIHGRAWTTRLVDVMHAGINLNRDNDADPKTMVIAAMNLDREIDEINALMPSVWDFEVVHLEQSSEHLHGKVYHIYLDPWIAQMWNNVKSCRLCLFKIVRENLNKGWAQHDPPLFTQNEYEAVKSTAEEISRCTVAEIVASVPQIIGMVPFPDVDTARRRASDPNIDVTSPAHKIRPPGTFIDATRSTHMLHLIWPLYAAAGLDLVTSEMRQWSIEILHYIALRLGNRQAVVLADELKEVQRTGIFTTPYADRTAVPTSPYNQLGRIITEEA